MTKEKYANEEMILQGDSKLQGINSSLRPQTGPWSDIIA